MGIAVVFILLAGMAVGTDMYAKNSWDNQNIYYAKDKNGDFCYYNDEFGQ